MRRRLKLLRRALKLSLPLALMIATLTLPTPLGTVQSAHAHGAGTCSELQTAISVRQLPSKFLSIAYRESKCQFHQVNSRGEYSVGYVQVNFRSGLPQRLGWTLDRALASEDNYWDMVVDIYNYCGLGPWSPRRVNGRKVYGCSAPANPALKLTDVYLIALAKEANASEAQ